MDVVIRTADPVSLAIAITAHGRQVGVHPWSDSMVKPGPAVLGAENDVKEDLAEGLMHMALRLICTSEPTESYEAGLQPAI